jgi:anti-sigma-K factor RskA
MNLSAPKYAEVRQQLCGEYVLGTLRGGARRRFAQLLRRDASLAAAVQLWEAQLTPLASHIIPQAPSDAVWQSIDARLFASKPIRAVAEVKTSWWNNLVLWRTASFGSAAAAVAMAAVLLVAKPAAPPMSTAVLTEAGEARIIVEQPNHGTLMVRMVKPWKSMNNENSMELWVVPKDGPPISLGLINEEGDTKITSKQVDAIMKAGASVALSKEAKGGSTNGKPTMLMCQGVLAVMPAKSTAKPTAKPLI